MNKFTGTFRLTPRKPKHWWNRTTYDFNNDLVDPLTYHHKYFKARPDRHYITDMRSGPNILDIIPAFQKDRYLYAVLFHDSAYKNKCWYVANLDSENYIKVILKRNEVDFWLKQMVFDLKGTPATAFVHWIFVRIFGSFSW